MPGTIVDTGDTAANKVKKKKNLCKHGGGSKMLGICKYLVGRWSKS